MDTDDVYRFSMCPLKKSLDNACKWALRTLSASQNIMVKKLEEIDITYKTKCKFKDRWSRLIFVAGARVWISICHF